MPFVKDPLSLLIEASDIDLKRNTKVAVRESTVRSSYENIEEAAEPVYYGPDVVPVIKIGNEFFTEMNFLHPYMKSEGITSIAEALNNVSETNGLGKGSVGLLIESDGCVSDCINKAIESCNPKKENSILNKVDKAVGVAKALKDKGINVKKKKSTECDGSCKKGKRKKSKK